ncbi:ABC transporter permease [Tuwongella immobilis]|uniref:ABC3 transporter permease C-terminal domain-containing protein n=1 Tax=Tuwongella immobilis TaxID=692036 RepID=A0A6C2YT36_9BACT|nr:ABC transporter permease [Tuwongella immobilis]VIP04293.1 abc transporter permease : Uncharacterized protein OS=Pirellula staleyi (strain ATCC 27377 / DSM 6068 / ICPB 4128) GN=Psta_2963 PE=4 SV=1: FtsX [Tuwongella immobilis]VTS05949.1 abc transporter permease : Uncharacterized protein OS=Pirellula staleyi (strain ATCC 27377 / DSM 6068 / ICPB 4128) GN=Psta_2963 PE=4 SV=1: FtsX [Tuwongella immobilis]
MFLFDLGGFFAVQFLWLSLIGDILGVFCIPLFFLVLFFFGRILALIGAATGSTLVRVAQLVLRSLQRNILRTSLSFLATFVLVLVVTLIWSVLTFLDRVTAEKETDLKAIITEKFQIPSQMPLKYANSLMNLAEEMPEEFRPKNGDMDLMTWQFVGATLDPAKRTFENTLFFFGMEPKKVLSMMDGLDDLTPEQRKQLDDTCKLMEDNIRGVVLGQARLTKLNKRVGDRIKATSINYKDLEFDFEIVGVFPPGRYDESALMNRDYLLRAMDDYKKQKGVPHPNEERTLNLIWIRLPNRQAFETLAEKVNSPGAFAVPAVKMETASSGIASFFDAYRDLIWGMRYLLGPAILATMSLVIANAISITVRERRTEMAVLKVLGFRPWQILLMVLGEAMLIGLMSGIMATSIAYWGVYFAGGLKFPIAFFPAFFVPIDALWWGPAIGGGTAFLGALFPALSARTVKVSEVFSRVA